MAVSKGKRYWDDEDRRDDKWDIISEVGHFMQVESTWSKETKYKPLGIQDGMEATTQTGYHIRANHYSGDPGVVQVIIYSPDYQTMVVCDNNVPIDSVDSFIDEHTR